MVLILPYQNPGINGLYVAVSVPNLYQKDIGLMQPHNYICLDVHQPTTKFDHF